MVTKLIVHAANGSEHTSPWNGSEVGDIEQDGAVLLSACGYGVRNRVIGACSKTGGHSDGIHSGRLIEQDRIGQYRLAVRDGAGLVECQPRELVSFFKINTALDQNTVAGCCCQAADDGDGGGNDQGARTGDDQENQRLVYPVLPVATK
ncbi:MAG: hypothetical protein AW10_00890 [Candidatus Accumulibacter appositus]|uniref:Uncharacterized protein n=1 Tax=Candidatus Accumulibacter appositus TaxID=1454003 RepID=A0A011PYI3_9PROT|nr:MAG: hypothetical protein AW10_00890 [Candidatus Accumulibacter appositus]